MVLEFYKIREHVYIYICYVNRGFENLNVSFSIYFFL